jgi:hypothetical protein
MVGGTAAWSHVFASKGAFSAFVYIQGSTPGYSPDDLHSYLTRSHLELYALFVKKSCKCCSVSGDEFKKCTVNHEAVELETIAFLP